MKTLESEQISDFFNFIKLTEFWISPCIENLITSVLSRKEWKQELKLLGEIFNPYANKDYEEGEELQNDAIKRKLQDFFVISEEQ